METILYITVCTLVIHLGQSSITGHALFMQQKAVQLGDAGVFYLHCCAAVSQATLKATILIQNTEYRRSLAAPM